MSYVNSNIRYLRKMQGMTQGELAEKIGLKRSVVGAYEEERAEPKIATIQKLSHLFEVPLDALVNTDLSLGDDVPRLDMEGKNLRVLPIVVSPDDRERITVVPVSAEAGYADSYGDPEFIESLPSFNLPVQELYPDQTYRLFQIHGDSMLPVMPGSYIICSYIEDWNSVRNGKCYVVVTHDRGVVYKRVWRRPDTHELLLQSDNTAYKPYTVEASEVREIWQALGYIAFELPDPVNTHSADMQQVSTVLTRIQNDVEGLKKTLFRPERH